MPKRLRHWVFLSSCCEDPTQQPLLSFLLITKQIQPAVLCRLHVPFELVSCLFSLGFLTLMGQSCFGKVFPYAASFSDKYQEGEMGQSATSFMEDALCLSLHMSLWLWLITFSIHGLLYQNHFIGRFCTGSLALSCLPQLWSPLFGLSENRLCPKSFMVLENECALCTYLICAGGMVGNIF